MSVIPLFLCTVSRNVEHLDELFHLHFTSDHLVRWRPPNQRFSRKNLLATWALTRCLGMVFRDSFNKAFYQCSFPAFMVFVQQGAALYAEDIDGSRRQFFIGFCHGL